MSGGAHGHKIIHYTEVQASEVREVGASGAKIRWLISKDDGAPNFSMRLFEIEPGGRTPLHSHPWEHEIFILEGRCKVIIGESEYLVGPGYAVYIPPNMRHTLINTGEGSLKLLCLIPHR
jgi:quercetin dioxygenase-like cupin family protein